MKKGLVAWLTAMLAAGCSEGTLAPKAGRVVDPTSLESTIPGGGSTASLTSVDTLRFSFVIDPSRDVTYNLGAGNTLYFPAHSLCDMSQSSYGNGEWDKPCVAATTSVTVNTKGWLDKKGYAHVDFDQHVRFIPTSNPAGWVMLSLSDYGASTLAWMNIEYCKDIKSGGKTSCIDESEDDPSVATVKDPITGRYTRHVKHFSGYSLTSGRSYEDSM